MMDLAAEVGTRDLPTASKKYHRLYQLAGNG